MNPANFPGNKDRKRSEAAVRAAEWTQKSLSERLAALDMRLGPGQGAVKERLRLRNQKERQ